jgi:hypothetical protein
MKIRPMGAELFHAGGRTNRTGMMNLIVFICNFVNAPKYEKQSRAFIGTKKFRRLKQLTADTD